MLLRPPRWVLVAEAWIVVCALAVLAYKAAMWVRPLGRVDQAQFLPKVDPKTRVREYYAQYPESYIRISKESWRIRERQRHRVARHQIERALVHEGLQQVVPDILMYF